MLLGYAISGERTLEMFYERVHPFANPFMALFGRDGLPARSTLPAFLPLCLAFQPSDSRRSCALVFLFEIY